jgi:hypothetical protein
MILAAVLLVVIIVVVVLLITKGLPPWNGDGESTEVAAATATFVPTFTPGPTKEPTNTPLPALTPTLEAPVMLDTEDPLFVFQNAGARPSVEWTGFFGQVEDSAGNPTEGVSVIVWYRDGTPASPVVRTDGEGYYEIRLADGPLAGQWSIQLLTDNYAPASKILSFDTDENTESGVQQIQVVWMQAP